MKDDSLHLSKDKQEILLKLVMINSHAFMCNRKFKV